MVKPHASSQTRYVPKTTSYQSLHVK